MVLMKYSTARLRQLPRYEIRHLSTFSLLYLTIILQQWLRYAVFEDPDHTFENFSISDIEHAEVLDPGEVNTWNGNFKAFRERGGKIVTYHGRQDAVSP
jgi:hypothetical protein